MSTTLEKLVKSFPTTPFLFVGSGLTRRYYNLPNWQGLLKYFSQKINNDNFSFASYENQAKSIKYQTGLFPKIAELIETDFNEKWYSDKNIRTLDESLLNQVENGVSPFKAEIAMYIKKISNLEIKYKNEVQLFNKISKKHITGIITTNYDCFLEENTDGYKPYIGQEELIFSSIQGIAEIYKIHGSIEKPNSIIINEEDYISFEKRCAYLAAKLMTIFLEYPIIFIGYSINDQNIQKIIESIINCLSDDNCQKLKNRFIFIEYDANFNDAEISPYTLNINGKILTMTKIRLQDFSTLYKALELKKAALPVKLLRLFKTEFYNYTLTNTPTNNLRVASIDNTNINNEDLVLAICKPSDIGLYGLAGITPDDWHIDIVLNNITYSADAMLDISYERIKRTVTSLPIYKYLSTANKPHPDIETIDNFDELISTTIKKDRYKYKNCSVKSIINDPQLADIKKMKAIAHLTEDNLNVTDLENYLKKYLGKNPNILKMKGQSTLKTDLRRLIKILDWLKYGKTAKDRKKGLI